MEEPPLGGYNRPACPCQSAPDAARTKVAPTPAEIDWNALLAPFSKPVTRSSVFQLVSTVLLLVTFWVAMYWSLASSYWLTLGLAVPAAVMTMRLFMLQHDCGHGSFFASQRANNIVGGILGVLTLVPYSYWRRTHAIHHASSGNLDARGLGDVDTLTVREYLSCSRWRRFRYRVYRHPAVMLTVGPIWLFLIKHRLPLDIPRSWTREMTGVQFTNLALVGVIALLSFLVGFENFLWIQVPIWLIAGSLGVYCSTSSTSTKTRALALPRGLELLRGRAGRRVTSPDAEAAAVGDGQHRAASHPSRGVTDPELPVAAGAGRHPRTRLRDGAHARRRSVKTSFASRCGMKRRRN